MDKLKVILWVERRTKNKQRDRQTNKPTEHDHRQYKFPHIISFNERVFTLFFMTRSA